MSLAMLLSSTRATFFLLVIYTFIAYGSVYGHEAPHNRYAESADSLHSHHSHGGSHQHNKSDHPFLPIALRLSTQLQRVLSPLNDLPLYTAAITASLISSSVSLVSILFLPFSSILSDLLLPFAAGALLADLINHLLPHAFSASAPPLTAITIMITIFVFAILDIILRRISTHDHTQTQSLSHSSTQKRDTVSVSASAAYINLTADAVHNFCDGLTIAAAFTVSRPAGIATTIATILHELPQELADFSLLLRSGLPTSGAIIANTACACAAVLGTIVALQMSSATTSNNTNVESGMFAVATGGMMYLTLCSVMPDMVTALAAPTSLVRFTCRLLCALLCASLGAAVVSVVEALPHSHGH